MATLEQDLKIIATPSISSEFFNNPGFTVAKFGRVDQDGG